MTLPEARGLPVRPSWPIVGAEKFQGLADDLFRLLMETMPAGAFVWEGERAVFANKAAERMSGYSAR